MGRGLGCRRSSDQSSADCWEDSPTICLSGRRWLAHMPSFPLIARVAKTHHTTKRKSPDLHFITTQKHYPYAKVSLSVGSRNNEFQSPGHRLFRESHRSCPKRIYPVFPASGMG